MESVLGFKDASGDPGVEKKSNNMKLVPWINWDEWKFVKESLFSKNPDSVASAIRRVWTWRSRGCIPVLIEVTASFVEIQQKDPYFRIDLDESDYPSEAILAMLYCMAIMRLINGVVEKTRKRSQVSIAEAADALSIPRMLIDIRHEGSHRDLPSLQLLQLASEKAVDWLKWYYWEPQEKMIPIPDHHGANLRKEINSSLREIALHVKAKSGSLPVKRKCVKKTGQTCGGGKFLFHAAVKASQPNSTGPKKQMSKLLNNILRLYSSFSPEVLDVMLEYLLNALESQSEENADASQTTFDGWISVVSKLSRRKPGFLLCLTQVVLDNLKKHEAGDEGCLQNSCTTFRAKSLLNLLECLTGNMKKLYAESPETKAGKIEQLMLKSTLMGLLKKCLVVSSSCNKQLMSSAIILAQLNGDTTVLQKLEKLASVYEKLDSEAVSFTSLDEEELFLQQAEEKFQSMKRRRTEMPPVKQKWVVTKSWNPCPIGMLPHNVGFSGRLPVLDSSLSRIEADTGNLGTVSGVKRVRTEVENEENTGDYKMSLDTENLENISAKTSEDEKEENTDFKGHLVINGVWRRVEELEVVDIASTVRLLI